MTGTPPVAAESHRKAGLLPPWAGVLGSVFVIGGAAAVIAIASQPWALVRAGRAEASVVGTDITAGVTVALAVAVLAGWLLGLALRRAGRQVLGVVLAAIGVGISTVSVFMRSPSTALALERLRTVSLETEFQVVATFWPQASITAGTLIMLGGLLLSRTRSAAGRFERSQTKHDLTAWDAIDAGEDPTVGDDTTPGRE